MQYKAVQHNTTAETQYSRIQCNSRKTMQQNTMQYKAMQHNTTAEEQFNTMQYNALQHNTIEERQ